MHITSYLGVLAALLALAPLSVSAKKKRQCHQARFIYQIKCDLGNMHCPGDPDEDPRSYTNIPPAAWTALGTILLDWEAWANTDGVTHKCGGFCGRPFKRWPGNGWYGYTWAMYCDAARQRDEPNSGPPSPPGSVELVEEKKDCDVHCESHGSCGFDFGNC
ncbi:hypothetical protein FKW77_007263 [Venturia effusa]|uniref:Uncharacterized protein n=1 Tax=Venturia effusa TaxID=50376 RepID=A0A517LFU7_9PEZI|nr:hypothetical protein FKW77_007263 [Venturia effusa]